MFSQLVAHPANVFIDAEDFLENNYDRCVPGARPSDIGCESAVGSRQHNLFTHHLSFMSLEQTHDLMSEVSGLEHLS